MPTRHGDLAVLDDPVVQRLLQSTLPAEVSYTRSEGTRCSVSLGFHWNGTEFVLGTLSDAPEMMALHDGAQVMLTIDSDTLSSKVLLIRGAVQTDTVDGITPEYEAMLLRVLGEEQARAWLESLRPICLRMSRIVITPEWAGTLDFTTRFPSAAERVTEHAQSRKQLEARPGA